jgi:hypothetical protein
VLISFVTDMVGLYAKSRLADRRPIDYLYWGRLTNFQSNAIAYSLLVEVDFARARPIYKLIFFCNLYRP